MDGFRNSWIDCILPCENLKALELLIIPLLFALVALIVPKNLLPIYAIIGGLISTVVAVGHVVAFVPSDIYVAIFDPNWTSTFGLTYKMGYDGISLIMVVLTNVVTFLILLANFNGALASNKLFTSMVFFMQVGLLGVFLSMDGLLFYVFWEISLIPVFLIFLWFGAPGRKADLIKFFIYTFIGSLAMLFALMMLKVGGPGFEGAASFSWEDLMKVQLGATSAFWVMGGFFLAFAVKIPLFPFHGWQPETYVKSPMAGTMLLSALMLKMALYGMMRWMLPLAPEAIDSFTMPVIVLGTIGVIYAAILAIRQKNIKRTFAFASISHVGLIAAGIMVMTYDAMTGAVVQMINHSLVAVGLFLAAEVIERRLGTQEYVNLGGIAKQAPRFGFWFGAIVFAGISIPLTSGFIGEFLLIRGVYLHDMTFGILIGTTLILACVYTFRAYQLSMNGPSKNFNFPDLTWNESAVFFVLMVLIVTIGVYPQVVVDIVEPSLKTLLDNINSKNIAQ